MSSPLSFDFDRPFGPSQRKGECSDSTRHRKLETAEASLDLKVLEDPYTLNLWQNLEQNIISLPLNTL